MNIKMLPSDILQYTLGFLNIASICNLSTANKFFRSLIDEEEWLRIWRNSHKATYVVPTSQHVHSTCTSQNCLIGSHFDPSTLLVETPKIRRKFPKAAVAFDNFQKQFRELTSFQSLTLRRLRNIPKQLARFKHIQRHYRARDEGALRRVRTTRANIRITAESLRTLAKQYEALSDLYSKYKWIFH